MAKQSIFRKPITLTFASICFGIGIANAEDYTLDNGIPGIIDSSQSLTNAIIGKNDSSNMLSITGLTTVVTSDQMQVGYNNSSHSNTLNITDGTLQISENLIVGKRGSDNLLNISSGGKVQTENLILGQEAQSTGNIVQLNTASTLYASNSISLNGKGNQLNVGTNSFAQVGSGLASTNGGSIVIGTGGNLLVKGEASINSSSGSLGLGSADTGKVTISGSGSVWNISDDLVIGDAGSNSTLTVENKGALNTSHLELGKQAGADNNTLDLSDSTVSVSNAVTFGSGANNSININNKSILQTKSIDTSGGSNNLINVRSGGELQITGDENLTTDTINFDKGSTVRAGGTLIIDELIDDGRIIIVDGALNTNLTSAITTSSLQLGKDFEGSELKIVNGGSYTNTGNLSIGIQSNKNKLTVSGSNSTARIGGSVVLGSNTGADNEFIVKDSAKVTVAGSFKLDESNVSNNNKLKLTDADSAMTIDDDFVVGSRGFDNSARIESGASLTNGGNTIIGEYSTSKENSLLVSGNNSTLTALSAQINADGKENSLTISDGGRADITNAVTLGGKGIDGALTVTGNNSVLSAALATADGKGNTLKAEKNGAILLGAMDTSSIPTFEGGIIAVSSSNTLATLSITNGASAKSDQGLIGIASNETGMVTISGSKSKWDTQNLQMGVHGSSNVLSIIDGGTITASNVVVGSNSEATENSISITGMDSKLTTEFLTIGTSNNIGNKVNVGDGALLTISETLSFNTNNTLNIKDGGTLFMENDFNLYDAETNGFNFNAGATLQVGGTLTATNTIEDGRHIALAGTSAAWNTENNLVVGGSTSNNTFSLLDRANFYMTNVTVGATATAHNNSLNVSDHALLVTDTILIGTEGSTNNTLNITDGGSVQINDSFSVSSNNFVNLNGGNLINIGNFDAKMASNLSIGSNSTLSVGGTLSINTNEFRIRNGGTIQIIGSLNESLTASWDIDSLYLGDTSGTGSLHIMSGGLVQSVNGYIGDLSSSNTVAVLGAESVWNVSSNLSLGKGVSEDNKLLIAEGGMVEIGNNAFIGEATSSNNYVQVSGTNSLWNVIQNLEINGFNSLNVTTGAKASVGKNLTLSNGASLNIGHDSIVTVGSNYTQNAGSHLNISAGKNSAGLLDVVGSAEFSTNTSIIVQSDDGLKAADKFEYTIIQAGSLVFGNSSTNTGNIFDFSLDLKGASNYVDGSTLVIKGTARSLAAIIGAPEDSQLESIANEIDSLGTKEADLMYTFLKKSENEQQANQAMDNYYGEKSSSSPANNAINLGLQNIANQLTMRADNTRSRSGAASAAINWNKLQGAAGPHEPDQELQGWISAYGSKGKQDGSSGFNGYDTRVGGFMVGADFTVSDNILLGVAGGSGTASVDKDNDSSSDSKTTYVAIYASAGTKSWFMDSSLIYGNTSIDSTLGSTFDTTADYDAKNMAFYFGGGKEIAGDYLIFTPQASLLGNYYKQNAYTEDATTAVAREVDSFDAFYLQSSLGASMGMYVGLGDVTLKPELRMHWLHEWNAKEEDLGFSLIGGANDYTMLLQAPEEDILKIGIGTSAKLGEFLELRADLDARLGADYSDTTLLGSIRYQF